MNLLAPGATFKTVIVGVIGLINGVLYLFIGIGIIFFFWGIVEYLRHPKPESRTNLAWSLVAIFVLVSFTGLVRILMNTFGVT